MEKSKFITLDNLKYFWGKVKTWFTDELNKLSFSDSSHQGKFVSEITQTNGKVSATYKDITVADVTGLESRLTTLNGAITSEAGKSVVTVESSEGEGDILKVYTIKQNGETVEGGTINIPRDFLVKSGEITTGTGANVSKKVLKLTLNAKEGSGTAQTVEIPVDDICDVYTPGNGLQESDNEFSIKIANSSSDVIILSATATGLGVSYTRGNVADGDTGLVNGGDLYTVKQTLEADIASLTTKVGEESVSSQITTEIGKLDVSEVGGEGKFIQKISQTDGKITATVADFSDIFEAVTEEEIAELFKD